MKGHFVETMIVLQKAMRNKSRRSIRNKHIIKGLSKKKKLEDKKKALFQ